MTQCGLRPGRQQRPWALVSLSRPHLTGLAARPYDVALCMSCRMETYASCLAGRITGRYTIPGRSFYMLKEITALPKRAETTNSDYPIIDQALGFEDLTGNLHCLHLVYWRLCAGVPKANGQKHDSVQSVDHGVRAPNGQLALPSSCVLAFMRRCSSGKGPET